jgi:hypothetical protein
MARRCRRPPFRLSAPFLRLPGLAGPIGVATRVGVPCGFLPCGVLPTGAGFGLPRAAFLLKDFIVVKDFRRCSVGNPSQQQKFT